MNTKITISKAIYSALFSAVMLFVTSSAFAQVKIGTSPTVIGANSNLEVEAANSKKVIVNKIDGTVVIENTPSSTNPSDKILGVDALGTVVTLSNSPVPLAPYLRVDGTYNFSSNQPTVQSPVSGLSTTLSNAMSYNNVNGDINFTSPGVYNLSALVTAGALSGADKNDVCLWVYKNNAVTQSVCSRTTVSSSGQASLAGGTASLSGIINVTLGDVFSIRLTTFSNVTVLNSYPVSFSFYKLSK